MKIKTAHRLEVVSEYYFSRKLKEIAVLRQQGIDVINLGIGSPDMAPAEEVIETVVSESRKPENHAYQSYSGIPALREAYAKWYRDFFGVQLNPENEILPLMGSKEGIMHVSMAFLNPGDGVLVPNPGYPAYPAVARLLGARIRYFDLTEENRWYPDLDALEKTDLSGVKIMWVNYPNMPTGVRASTELFTTLTDFGLRHNILIVNDNPYSFILNEEQLSLLSIPGAKEIALELNSLSKSHNMAGWRLGMLAGHSEYVSAVLQVKSNMDSGMFKPLQLAAVKALQQPAGWYRQLNEIYRERREAAFEILNALQCTYDKNQTGMFVWAKIPEKSRDSEQFSDSILKKNQVFLSPGFIFGQGGVRYVRLSLCSEKSRLLEAASRIKEKPIIKQEIIS
ncbi:MAG: aminotransferase [bacterium]|nr:MAG: aminotransferase [bacterium]